MQTKMADLPLPTLLEQARKLQSTFTDSSANEEQLTEATNLAHELVNLMNKKRAKLEERALKMKQTLENFKAERVEQETIRKEQLQLIMELKGKVLIFVRVRPSPPDEAAKRIKNLITFSKAIKASGQGVDLLLKGKVYHFTVDERFSEDASQEDIYK